MKNNTITIIFIIAVVVQIITMIVMEKYDWAFLIVLESSWGFTLGWLESEIHNSNHIKKLIKENMRARSIYSEYCILAQKELKKKKEAADD